MKVINLSTQNQAEAACRSHLATVGRPRDPTYPYWVQLCEWGLDTGVVHFGSRDIDIRLALEALTGADPILAWTFLTADEEAHPLGDLSQLTPEQAAHELFDAVCSAVAAVGQPSDFREPLNTTWAYVYILTSASYPGWLKVGFTERDVEERRKELSSGTGVRDPYQIAAVFRVVKGRGFHAEKLAHRSLEGMERRKEFFRCTVDQAKERIGTALAVTAENLIDVKATRLTLKQAYARVRDLGMQSVRLECRCSAESEEVRTQWEHDKKEAETQFTAKHVKRIFWNRIAAVPVVCCIEFTVWKVLGLNWALIVGVFSVAWIPLLLSRYLPLFVSDIPAWNQLCRTWSDVLDTRMAERQAELQYAQRSFTAEYEEAVTSESSARSALREFKLSTRIWKRRERK